MKIATSIAIVGGMIASALSASAALNLPTVSCSYTFNTNMRLGSRGTDVMNLQKTLNMWPQTRVAVSGAGSSGMETSTFGPATRAAVNKFQALHLVELGITAPTGNVYAGTRALLNMACAGQSTLPAGCTSTSGFSPTTGQSCGNGQPTTTTPGQTSGPVSAVLSGSQPTGTIVSGQAGARLADITFTGNGTVTNVQLQRIGVSSDATLNNVYLYDGNVRITDAASVITGGYINFNAPSGLFTVNGSRTITVRADIAAGTTAGQTVGVKLNSVTAGGNKTTFTNVVGNTLSTASVTTASVNFATIATTTRTVDAGTTNFNVWSGSANVGTRDVWFRAATFKFVGSAPVDSLANLSLYVDGTKVAGPATVNAANNNKVTFDFGNAPYLLKTGTHTIDVRGDVVKGSNRTITFSVENVSDLMFEDSQLSGVNIAAVVNNQPFTQSGATYGTITVNRGTVTANVDPAFTANRVTGGATNVPISQFILKAYGEDVKVNTLTVTPTLSGAQISGSTTPVVTGLQNVSLYVNGGQVGTSQNMTGNSQALTFNLGSSLVVPAGQTVTLTVKADTVNGNNSAYTAGTVSASISGSNNAQGQSSYELTSVPGAAVTGNTLTIGAGAGTFARTSGFAATTVSPNSTNVRVGSFTLQANSSEAVRVNSIGVNTNVSGYAQTNISNLRVQTGSTVLGTPVGNPATGTTTFSFNDVTIPANGTMTFDVYADIGGATTGSTTVAMDITYRGAVSNTTTTSSAAGSTVTTSAATLSAPTLNSSSPVSQFVVGGSTFGIATFKLGTVTSGTQANVRELRFTTTGTDAIESITVGGVTSSVISNGTTTVSGINIPISSSGTDVPVIVKFAQFQNNAVGQSGSLQSGATTTVTLGYIEATSGSGSVVSTTTTATSNAMRLVGSKPTVSVSAGATNYLQLNAESKVGEVTVTADANGRISVDQIRFNVSANGVSAATFGSFRIADGNTTISNSSTVVTSTSTNSAVVTSTFSPSYDITAGTSKTFTLFGTIGGTQTGSAIPQAVSSVDASNFLWKDVIGGNTQYSGVLIFNFPTNSYATRSQ
ncbi:MAG: baaA1 [Candidatus Nomurabacteria bacterium]|nr:baaA1 [Candidatus Nomurabacteria bacterium]